MGPKALFLLLVSVIIGNSFAGKCPDLASLRSDYVASSFSEAQASGFWYELAYIDLAQIGETCQWYNKTVDTSTDGSTGMSEEFGFTYGSKLASHMDLFYTNTEEMAVYEKYLVRAPITMFPIVVLDVIGADVGVGGSSDSRALKETEEMPYEVIVEYLCDDVVGPIKYEEVRVGARNTTISDEAWVQVQTTLQRAGVDPSALKYVDHTDDCKYK